MNIVIKQSEFQIIELEELKGHLRIEHDHEDKYLVQSIEMATGILENSIERPIIKKKYKYIASCNVGESTSRIELPLRDVDEILSVKQRSPHSTRKHLRFSVETRLGSTFIIINESKFNVEIKYTAGTISKAYEIPSDLKYATLQIAKNIYDCNDENVLEKDGLKNIIDRYKRINLEL
jgi:uncharacterized phiE125 gp8 family phage protein